VIVAPLRLVAAVLAFLLLLLVAVGGMVVAIFCLRGDSATLSLAHLASLLSLDDLRDKVGTLLGTVEADGPVAALAVLCGAGAVLLGLALIAGALLPRREGRLIVERDARGTIDARRRAVGDALTDLAERPRGPLGAKAKVRPNRSGTDERPVAVEARRDLAQLGEALSLKLQTVTRRPRRGGRAI
jgi:hypothetical protein